MSTCRLHYPIINTILLILSSGIQPTNSKFEEGQIQTFERWAFITRFCFLSEDGQFEYHIQYDQSYGPVNLLLYYDSENQWPAVYKSNKSCREREAVLNRRLNQLIPLIPGDLASGCSLTSSPPPPASNASTEVSASAKIVDCHQGRRFHSSRERWWFLAVSSCNSTLGLKLRYKFLMTNGAPGDYWHEHFSADEFYILPVLMTYSIVYIILVLAVIMCAMELKSRQLYHTTYKLFAWSVYLEELGIFTLNIAYLRYAVDGVGLSKLRNLGRLLEAASEVLFLLVLLLMAKGYTITRGRLRLSSSVKLTVFICLYVIMYITLFIYEKLFFDPGEVLYLFESPAGYGLVVLRLAAWWGFVYATVFTLKHYPEKSTFYYPFNLIATIWFVGGPAFILAANTLIDKWVRESVVCAVQHFIALTGHILFLVLTVPNKANKNFPYHVRTTQIGIMEVANGISGNNTLDQFGHHPYAIGGVPGPVAFWQATAATPARVPLELFTITSPRGQLRSTDRSFKFPEDRPFSAENLIIRPEEILATPLTAPSTSGPPQGSTMKQLRFKTDSFEEGPSTSEGVLAEETSSRPQEPQLVSPRPNGVLKNSRFTNSLDVRSTSEENTDLGLRQPPSVGRPDEVMKQLRFHDSLDGSSSNERVLTEDRTSGLHEPPKSSVRPNGFIKQGRFAVSLDDSSTSEGVIATKPQSADVRSDEVMKQLKSTPEAATDPTFGLQQPHDGVMKQIRFNDSLDGSSSSEGVLPAKPVTKRSHLSNFLNGLSASDPTSKPRSENTQPDEVLKELRFKDSLDGSSKPEGAQPANLTLKPQLTHPDEAMKQQDVSDSLDGLNTSNLTLKTRSANPRPDPTKSHFSDSLHGLKTSDPPLKPWSANSRPEDVLKQLRFNDSLDISSSSECVQAGIQTSGLQVMKSLSDLSSPLPRVTNELNIAQVVSKDASDSSVMNTSTSQIASTSFNSLKTPNGVLASSRGATSSVTKSQTTVENGKTTDKDVGEFL